VLYGRDRERAAIAALLDAAQRSVGGALVLRGAPGIGKSALLAEARAVAGDVVVLAARGIEAEADLPFAAVHQLLRPVWADVTSSDDGDGAVLREAFGAGVESARQRFLVYSSCLGVLSEVAARRPVLCLIDDAQWLDSASAEALRFCARRLACEPVAMLFAVRSGDGARSGDDGLPSLVLEPLDTADATALLRRTVEVTDGVAARIVDQARGNPLALIELPRALADAQLAGTTPLPEELPLTAQLEASYRTRVERLPAEVQQVLLLVATDGSEDVRVVARAASSMGLDPQALDVAERAGLLRVDGNQLEFTHPLVRSSLLGAATSGDRRAAHRTIAAALEGLDEHADRRAWHLADGAVEPDEAVVAELEEAARRAERRGGQVAAARALERAAALSTDAAANATRLVLASYHLSVAARDEDALRLLDAVDVRALDPRRQATASFVRASAAIRHHGRPAEAVPDLVATARRLAPEHPGLAIGLLPVATFAAWQAWDHEAQLEAADVAAAIDARGLSATEQRLAESVAGFAAMIAGDSEEARRLLRRTVEWGRGIDDAQQVIWAGWAALWAGDDGAFDELLRRAATLARAAGEIGALTDALGMHSVQLALLAQRYDAAAIAANEALQLAADLGAESLTLLPRSALAIVAAIRGDDAAAQQHGEDVVRAHQRRSHPFRASPGLYALAMVDMAAGRWDGALGELAQITDTNDPALAIAAPEVVEAAVRSGRPEASDAAFALYELRVEGAGGDDRRARLAACRALRADGDTADRLYAEAGAHLAIARPFDRARVQLLHGEHLRRRGDRQAAREQLRAALDGFDVLGAEPWAERARRELQATGETARRRSPDAVTTLTPQELQIARLVADGLTNKEVAAQLYLSPRTIDAHLRGVFAKLGIASRRDLRSLPALAAER
jgi:DNA-binding CsgD family transcriptional regulator